MLFPVLYFKGILPTPLPITIPSSPVPHMPVYAPYLHYPIDVYTYTWVHTYTYVHKYPYINIQTLKKYEKKNPKPRASNKTPRIENITKFMKSRVVAYYFTNQKKKKKKRAPNSLFC